MKTFSLSALANYKTTILGIAGAILGYLIQHHIGNVGFEQMLQQLDLLLLGAAASDAAK